MLKPFRSAAHRSHGASARLRWASCVLAAPVGLGACALLDRFKVGDKVRFKAEKIGGAYTVTLIEAAG